MSSRRLVSTLNLGSQSIELAQFRLLRDGGVMLCGYRAREFLLDPETKGTRDTRIAETLRAMMSELRMKNGPVVYTVAEEATFTRFVELPRIETEKIERIIFFEAQQNVPFPIDEVVWDYQLVGGGANEQIQVVLVAIKADWLEKINRTVEEAGLRPFIVDLATMALYNAFHYNYGDLSGCSLLLDIGARTTNLLFVEPGKIFARSVPLGGSLVTSAIAREFNESFAAAELRKKRSAVLRGSREEMIATEAEGSRVAQIAGSVLTRLHAEVMRSISHYCTQQRGNRPERVFLAGGGAGTPDIQQFFREKLKLPVDFFDALRKVPVADSSALDIIAGSEHLLGEPVGLALRAASRCPIELNLLPPSVVRRQQMERRRPYFVLAAACLVLGLLAWATYFWRAAQVENHATSRLQEKIDAMRRIEAQMSQVRKQTSALDNESAPLVAAINERSFWPLILEDLNERLPKEDIWITDLIPISGGKPLAGLETRAVVAASPTPTAALPRPGATPAAPAIDGLLVRGLYLFNPKQQEVVVDYFRNLVSSPWFAIDPNNQAKAIKPTTPNNTEWAFPYELHLDLKKPVPLP
jgi:type IV pilus assembly protein PilM